MSDRLKELTASTSMITGVGFDTHETVNHTPMVSYQELEQLLYGLWNTDKHLALALHRRLPRLNVHTRRSALDDNL